MAQQLKIPWQYAGYGGPQQRVYQPPPLPLGPGRRGEGEEKPGAPPKLSAETLLHRLRSGLCYAISIGDFQGNSVCLPTSPAGDLGVNPSGMASSAADSGLSFLMQALLGVPHPASAGVTERVASSIPTIPQEPPATDQTRQIICRFRRPK